MSEDRDHIERGEQPLDGSLEANNPSAASEGKLTSPAGVVEDEPKTEEALNVPKLQTIVMLGLMSLLTLIVWFAARLSCNLHPDQVREPRHYSLAQLAALPKNAGFEFLRRYHEHDLVAAMDLSTDGVLLEMQSKVEECEREPDACEARRAALAGTVEGVASLLDQKEDTAVVEVSLTAKELGQKTFTLSVKRDGNMWKVSERREGGVVHVAPTAVAEPAAGAEPSPSAALPEASAAEPKLDAPAAEPKLDAPAAEPKLDAPVE
jgi:hypothetical protein